MGKRAVYSAMLDRETVNDKIHPITLYILKCHLLSQFKSPIAWCRSPLIVYNTLFS